MIAGWFLKKKVYRILTSCFHHVFPPWISITLSNLKWESIWHLVWKKKKILCVVLNCKIFYCFLQTYGSPTQLTKGNNTQWRRYHHVPENVLHYPDCGCVCGVRVAHLLGNVWDSVHQALWQPQKCQLYLPLAGRKPQTAGINSEHQRVYMISPFLHSVLY